MARTTEKESGVKLTIKADMPVDATSFEAIGAFATACETIRETLTSQGARNVKIDHRFDRIDPAPDAEFKHQEKPAAE